MEHYKFICVLTALFGPILVTSFDPTIAKIYGGKPAADAEAFPYQVSLRYVENDGHFCGGSILNEYHVLTAAHCFYVKNEDGFYTRDVHNVKIVAGQINLTLTEDSITRLSKEIIIHPDLPPNLLANDIAIIKVKEPFDFHNPYVTKVALASGDNSDWTKCFVSGWGATEKKQISEQLLFTPLELIPTSKCQKSYEKKHIQIDEDSILCAGWGDDNKHDACTGDSGGPLICNGLLTGVVSFGIGCAQSDYAGVYTKITHFNNWIKETLGEATFEKDEL